MNDWVGGRFSLMELSGACNKSMQCRLSDNFESLLIGANNMDVHFKASPLRKKYSCRFRSLISVWYNNFFKCETQGIIPYTQYLNKLPAYLTTSHNGK